jgi:hypothetical protein
MASKYQPSKQLHAIRRQLLQLDQQFREGFQRECMYSSCEENANDTGSPGSLHIAEEVCLLL